MYYNASIMIKKKQTLEAIAFHALGVARVFERRDQTTNHMQKCYEKFSKSETFMWQRYCRMQDQRCGEQTSVTQTYHRSGVGTEPNPPEVMRSGGKDDVFF